VKRYRLSRLWSGFSTDSQFGEICERSISAIGIPSVTSDDGFLEDDQQATIAGLQDRLTSYFAGRVNDPVVQQELVGRVNERVLKRSHDGTVIEDVERFAFGVARHVLQEHWREEKRRHAFEVTLSETIENLPRVAATVTGTSGSSRALLLGALNQCIEELPETDRMIARRCYAEGKSKDLRAAIAEEMGLSRNALDARLSRIRAKLESCVRARLEPPGESDVDASQRIDDGRTLEDGRKK